MLASAPARVALGATFFVAVLIAELAVPLRPRTWPAARRIAINLGLAVVGGLLLAVAYGPVVEPVVAMSEARGFGLLRVVSLPGWARLLVTIVLLDYTLWIWHWLNHRVPFLWRFHAAHHVDGDVDASTALRFHFGELALSLPYRAAQLALIGPLLTDVMIWQTGLLLATVFHHANLRLPRAFERVLGWLVVTPRLHGTHHAIEPYHLDSNFGTILTVWDRVHRTFAAPVENPVLGIPEMPAARLGLVRSLALPFGRRPPAIQ